MLRILLFSALFSFTTTKLTSPPHLAAMSTQYDAIAVQYGSMKDLPAGSLERPSVDAIIGNITGLRCLDLASGLGRWSKYLLRKRRRLSRRSRHLGQNGRASHSRLTKFLARRDSR